MRFDIFRLLLSLLMSASAFGATFGKAVVIGGHASDIALDERRGLLYIANLGGNRIDVMSTQDLTLKAPIPYISAPAAVALSSDDRYLAVSQVVENVSDSTESVAIVFDLDAHTRRVQAIVPGHSLAIAFGNSPQAIMASTSGFYRIDPISGAVTRMAAEPAAGMDTYATCVAPNFPPDLTGASSTVSGDGNVLWYLVNAGAGACPGNYSSGGGASLAVKYEVLTGKLSYFALSAEPALAPGSSAPISRAIRCSRAGAFSIVINICWRSFRVRPASTRADLTPSIANAI